MVQRGNPLFKCQAVHAILSLLLLFPLFCTSQSSDSPPSPLLCCLLCVCACGCDRARASLRLTLTILVVLSLCHQSGPTGENKRGRRMHVGVKEVFAVLNNVLSNIYVP